MNDRTVSFAVVRELLETALKNRTGILNRASDGSEQLQLHPPVPPLDFRLFAEIAPQKVRLGMKPLQIPANGDRLGEIMSHHQVPGPAPHRMSSLRGIRACGSPAAARSPRRATPPSSDMKPLSLDEAYLDVTENLRGTSTASATAAEIRARIFDETIKRRA